MSFNTYISWFFHIIFNILDLYLTLIITFKCLLKVLWFIIWPLCNLKQTIIYVKHWLYLIEWRRIDLYWRGLYEEVRQLRQESKARHSRTGRSNRVQVRGFLQESATYARNTWRRGDAGRKLMLHNQALICVLCLMFASYLFFNLIITNIYMYIIIIHM